MLLMPLSKEARLAWFEAALVAAAAPALVFPGPSSPVAAFLLAAALFVRHQRTARFWVPGPLDAAVFLLGLSAVVAVGVSAVSGVSAPKAWGLLLGLAAYSTAAHLPRTETAATAVMVLLTVLLALVIGVALVGTDWDKAALAPAPWLYERLPRLMRGLADPSAPVPSDWFNPRQIGGALALLLPIVAIGAPRRGPLAAPLTALLIIAFAVLLLTQAPSAIVGVGAAGLLALAVFDRPRRWLWTALGALGALAAAAAFTYLVTVPGTALTPEALAGQQRAGFGLVSRLEIWQRALAMAADMPYTGIGLNAFPLVMERFYPGVVLGPESHAHNLWLQAAVDFGLPGLAAFIGLLAGAGLLLHQVIRTARDPGLRRMAVGVAAGLLSFGIFGTIDTVWPGAKPALLFWLALGLASLLYQLTPGVVFPTRRFVAVLLGAVALVQVVPLATAGPVRNLAHMLLHRATLARPQPDPAGLRAALPWLREAAETVGDGRSWHLVAEAEAHLGNLDAATDALRRGLAADRAAGIGAYTPGEALAQGDPDPPPEQAALALQRVYRAWWVRYPDRALGFMAATVTWCEVLGNRDAALATLDAGPEAQPQGWLQHYRATVVARPDGCTAAGPHP